MTERRRFLAKVSGMMAAVAAAPIVDPPGSSPSRRSSGECPRPTRPTEFRTKNAIALERLGTEFKSKVEVLPLPVPVLRDPRKLAAEVVREESEKTSMARKMYASFTKYQALASHWDHVAEDAFHHFVAG